MQLMLSVLYVQPQFHIVTYVMSLLNVYNVHQAFSYLLPSNNVNSVHNTLRIVFIVRMNQNAYYVTLNILSKTVSVKNVPLTYQDAIHVQIQHIVQHVKMAMHTILTQQAAKHYH